MKKQLKTKILAAFMSIAMLAAFATGCTDSSNNSSADNSTTSDNSSVTSEDTNSQTGTPEAIRDISSMELVKEMGVGINLGNTFESAGSWIAPTGVTSYEQAWGSPIITREMSTAIENIHIMKKCN